MPDLRIIIDHLAGAKGKTPTPEWVADVKKLAAHKNIYIKFSSFFDMFNPAATEDNPWKAPDRSGLRTSRTSTCSTRPSAPIA